METTSSEGATTSYVEISETASSLADRSQRSATAPATALPFWADAVSESTG